MLLSALLERAAEKLPPVLRASWRSGAGEKPLLSIATG
jgi:hypothetical protein